MWSNYKVWSVKCRVSSVEYNVECKCRVYSVKCKVRSVKCRWSVFDTLDKERFCSFPHRHGDAT